MTSFSTNALTKRYCEMQGWPHECVQTWRGNKRHDLFGVADSLALVGNTPLLIQNCSYGSLLEHRRKLVDLEGRIDQLLACGFSFELWEWKRKKHDGHYQWFLRAESYTPAPSRSEPWTGPFDLYPRTKK